MEQLKTIDGIVLARMINFGATNLKQHAKEINDLNVFPIPDGDTGDNMLLTIKGGIHSEEYVYEKLCESAKQISDGMLLSARGNSGVILSQFFEGIKNGFSGLDNADTKAIGEAFRKGVDQAYCSVMEPTEGTILTVAREATEYACNINAESPKEFLNAFITEARQSLARTPELLPVLKKAGVVDSGAAGLIYIIDGMLKGINGDIIIDSEEFTKKKSELDFDAFGEDSVLEFGYCTELLIRLQNSKINIPSFDIKEMTDYLQTVGDSIVTTQTGSIVKLHIHTMTPDKVLAFCQRYGEFLKVKIENMSLQHNNTQTNKNHKKSDKNKKYGIVAVASGDGLKQFFYDRGADVVVEGGQSMNPSTEDFIDAFNKVNAETIFVFPNNSNIILTAKQAAALYKDSDVRVIESTTIGAGYASLSMLDYGSGNTDTIVSQLTEAMDGVVTAEISHCIREASIENTRLCKGDYIGFVGKNLLAVNKCREDAVYTVLEKINFSEFDICILIYGCDSNEEEANRIKQYIAQYFPDKEVYIYNGMQEVYDYIIILE